MDGSIADLCQAIPGTLLTGTDFGAERQLLLSLRALAGAKFLPGQMPKQAGGKPSRTPDLFANLWFIQASYAYLVASQDEATWREALLPFAKQVAQGVISDAFRTTHMDDGGLLAAAKGAGKAKGKAPFPALQLNILWYNAISIIAQEYRRLGDRAADHFDRLAARFRRSFLKAYWCDVHSCLCDSTEPAHGSSEPHFDPLQILAVELPFSAVPHTKQAALVEFLRDRIRTPMGLTLPAHWAPSKEGKAVLSPLCLVWLAEARIKTFEPRARAVADARAWLGDLHERLGAGHGLPQFVDPHTLLPVPADAGVHRPTVAELQRVWGVVETLSMPVPPKIPNRPKRIGPRLP